MAGGANAEFIACMDCAGEGVVTRAERVHEGVEGDRYCCPRGHAFGVDWRRGPPSSPQWPLTAGQIAEIEAMSESEPPPRRIVADTAVRRFVHGVATRPAGALAAWLDAHREGRPRLRVPVVLVRGEVGFSLQGATIGGGPDALTIRLDDCALGVGLAERARQACGDAAACALWLEGHWRGGDDRVLVVVKTGPAIAADDRVRAAVEIEAT